MARVLCTLVLPIAMMAAFPARAAAPQFTTRAAGVIGENSADRIFKPAATDADGDTVTITIAGGADATLFRIGGGGYLRFRRPPDFENPRDRDRNNRYQITLHASDGTGVRVQYFTVFVRNIDDGGPGAAYAVRRIAIGFDQPLFVLGRGDGTNRIFVVEKTGKIKVMNLNTGAVNATPVLDLSTEITKNGERGLLGMALAPNFAASGEFYLNLTNLAGDTEIRRYRMRTDVADRADPASGDIIMKVAQPAGNHNGGWLGFGMDRMLYIALGDGGGANDTYGNGQNLNTLLAKILRVDPRRDAFRSNALRDYSIPSDNPLAGGGGAPEMFAYGLRNPFRASVDPANGVIFIGDVGQNAIEEIDFIRPIDAGLNFGWPIMEGTRVNAGGSTAGLSQPTAEYAHGSGAREGDSTTGGYVYRGPVIPLWGQYIFGDFISGNIWSIPADIVRRRKTIPSSSFAVRTLQFTPDVGIIDQIASFGEDDQGNLYIVGIDGEIYKVEAE